MDGKWAANLTYSLVRSAGPRPVERRPSGRARVTEASLMTVPSAFLLSRRCASCVRTALFGIWAWSPESREGRGDRRCLCVRVPASSRPPPLRYARPASRVLTPGRVTSCTSPRTRTREPMTGGPRLQPPAAADPPQQGDHLDRPPVSSFCLVPARSRDGPCNQRGRNTVQILTYLSPIGILPIDDRRSQ